MTSFAIRAQSIACLLILLFSHSVAFGQSPRIYNYAKSFDAFWKNHKDKTMIEQVEAFKVNMLPTFPQYYKYKFDKWIKQSKNPSKEIERFLLAHPKIESEFKERANRIEKEIADSILSFKSSFPDFDTNFDIYVIHSLGEMDGGMRTLDGKSTFIFGIDGIIKYHNGISDVPFFHHELFHAYHSQHFQPEETILFALWAEGLATYVSKALNLTASYQDLMLDTPKGLREACEARLPELWALLKANLNSNSEDEYERWFLMSPKENDIPRRAGYYLGYLLAEKLSKSLSLQELSRLNGEDLKKRVHDVINNM